MPLSPSSGRQPYVFIEFAPTSGCLGSIVSVVTDFCRHFVDDSTVRFAFQLAAYELTENLVKYATGGFTSLRIEVENSPRGPEIVLTSQNEAPPERIADAVARLEAIEQSADPMAYFDALVRESLAAPDGCQLGLGRLRAEGNFRLSHCATGSSLIIQVRRSACGIKEGTSG
jgi:hypothetical protein